MLKLLMKKLIAKQKDKCLLSNKKYGAAAI